MPPPTPGHSGTSATLHQCVWGPGCIAANDNGQTYCTDGWQVPSNICQAGKITPYLDATGLTGALRVCLSSVLTYLCSAASPAAKVQAWGALQNVISRNWDKAQYEQIISSCLANAGPTLPTPNDTMMEALARLLNPGLCDAAGNLQGVGPTQ